MTLQKGKPMFLDIMIHNKTVLYEVPRQSPLYMNMVIQHYIAYDIY